MIFSYSWKLVARNPLRSFTFLFGLALSVALFSGILFFVDTMSRGMTEKALAPVSLDLVAQTTRADVDTNSMGSVLSHLRGVQAAETVLSADFATPVVGRMFAIQPRYLSTFPIVKLSEGNLVSGSMVISETMAVAQRLKVGDRVAMSFSGVPFPVELSVSGIVNLEGAEALFSSGNEAENALVADVVFVDLTWFQNTLLAPLTKVALDPATSPAPGAVVLSKQIHLKLDRAALPSDPTAAAVQADALRRSIERQYPGDLKAVDHLSGALTAAKSDVLSAKVLLVFLGLPGVFLAASLSTFTAELFAESRRREISLLRSRGARPGQIAGIVTVSSFLLALLGSALGLILGLGLVGLAGVPLTMALVTNGSFGLSIILSLLVGVVLSFLAGFLPTFRALGREVLDDRRWVRRQDPVPFWKKAWLDVIFIALSLAVLAITQLSGGFKPTGNEGQAVELSFYIFLSPLFAWIGLTLLTMRLVEAFLRRKGNGLPSLFQLLLGGVGRMAAKAMPRRSHGIAAATTVVALTLSFGISLLIFQQTYSAEKRLDSQYVVGADLRVTPALNAPQTDSFSQRLVREGVTSVTSVVRDPLALVGMEKNTVYGIDVASFRRTAYLPDSFFVDGTSERTLAALRDKTTAYAPGTARQVLDSLAATPNGVILSVEQAQKYNIQMGDPVVLKLYNRVTKEYHPIEAKAVGLFVFFPTSSQDSDFILNSSFMTKSSGSTAVDNFLIKVGDDPSWIGTVSTSIANQFKDVIPLRVQNTDTVIKVDSSSLTSLNLGGLGVVELIYTVVVASIGLGVFLTASVNERKREFGTMRAFGADARHLRQMVFAESSTIASISLVLGTIVGLVLAGLFVTLLSVIFTIPPQGLVVPLMPVAGLLCLVVIGMAGSTLLSTCLLGNMKVVEALREL